RSVYSIRCPAGNCAADIALVMVETMCHRSCTHERDFRDRCRRGRLTTPEPRGSRSSDGKTAAHIADARVMEGAGARAPLRRDPPSRQHAPLPSPRVRCAAPASVAARHQAWGRSLVPASTPYLPYQLLESRAVVLAAARAYPPAV